MPLFDCFENLPPKKLFSLSLTFVFFGFGDNIPDDLSCCSLSPVFARSNVPDLAYASMSSISSLVTLVENFFKFSFLSLSYTVRVSHSISS